MPTVVVRHKVGDINTWLKGHEEVEVEIEWENRRIGETENGRPFFLFFVEL